MGPPVGRGGFHDQRVRPPPCRPLPELWGGVLANFHYGIDFATPGHAGTIVAVTDMKIVKIRHLDGTFGSGVTGQTTNGELTIGYYHMEAGSLKVKEGDVVAAGTPLGTEGATGNVTGRHLHMEFFPGALPNPHGPGQPDHRPSIHLQSTGSELLMRPQESGPRPGCGGCRLSGCTSPAVDVAPDSARTSSTASGSDSHPEAHDEDHGVPAVTWGGPATHAEVRRWPLT